ncbi:MAG: hypothetical protein HC771_04945 [Synechococcales cyanobacterium CRU_2_2]|nr:hypothetical protein [Synechococcales cyanobacterium CRU_2_2]
MTDRSLPGVVDGSLRCRSEKPYSEKPYIMKPYIVRPETTAFLEKLTGAIGSSVGPRLFQVWGVGGVGKSTVLTKAEEALAGKAICSRVSFGATDGIESPIGLMEVLAEPLAQDDWGSEFSELFKLYQTTLIKLEQEPAERGKGINEEQKNIVQTLGNLALGWMQRGMPEEKAKEFDQVGGQILDAGLNTASAALTLVQRHQATKKDKALQELMLDPIPKLTTAFAKLLREQGKPVLLLLDTYEKAPLEIDTWLWRTLMVNQDVGQAGLGQAVWGRRVWARHGFWWRGAIRWWMSARAGASCSRIAIALRCWGWIDLICCKPRNICRRAASRTTRRLSKFMA